MTATHAQLVAWGRQGAYTRLAREGAQAVGARLQQAKVANYERRVDPDGVLAEGERRARAEYLMQAQLAAARAARKPARPRLLCAWCGGDHTGVSSSICRRHQRVMEDEIGAHWRRRHGLDGPDTAA